MCVIVWTLWACCGVRSMLWACCGKRLGVVGLVCVLGVVVGVDVGVMGSRHRLVRGSRSPWRTRHCLCQMLHFVFVNVAVHPASQRVLMEMSDEWESPGTMWARVADCGSPGMSKLHVWVDRRTEPSGMVTVMGLLSTCLFMTCACVRMKWPVAPESPRAYCVGIGVVGLIVVWGGGVCRRRRHRRRRR